MNTVTQYRTTTKLKEKIGILGFWGALLLLLLDMTTPFPTPARGAFAMWWLLAVIGAGVVWLQSRRLPIEETIALAEQHDAQLTVPRVTRELGISISMATKTLDAICEYGEAQAVAIGRHRTWFFFNTNPGHDRVTRAMALAQAAGGNLSPEQLVQQDGARDLHEAEALLLWLAKHGYLAT